MNVYLGQIDCILIHSFGLQGYERKKLFLAAGPSPLLKRLNTADTCRSSQRIKSKEESDRQRYCRSCERVENDEGIGEV